MSERLSLTENKTVRRLAMGAAVAGLALTAACGSSEKTDASSSTGTTPGVEISVVPTTQTPQKGVEVTFNWLGGNGSDILVYSDYGPNGKHSDVGSEPGAAPNAATVLAVCESEGREVYSKPGEQDRKSSEWVGFYLNQNLTFATETYLDVPASVHQLPDCNTVPATKPQ